MLRYCYLYYNHVIFSIYKLFDCLYGYATMTQRVSAQNVFWYAMIYY